MPFSGGSTVFFGQGGWLSLLAGPSVRVRASFLPCLGALCSSRVPGIAFTSPERNGGTVGPPAAKRRNKAGRPTLPSAGTRVKGSLPSSALLPSYPSKLRRAGGNKPTTFWPYLQRGREELGACQHHVRFGEERERRGEEIVSRSRSFLAQPSSVGR